MVSIGVLFVTQAIVRIIIGPFDRRFFDGEKFILKATEFKEMTHFGKALMQFYNHHFEHLAPPSIVKRTLEKLARLGGDTFQKPKLTEEQIIELRQFYKDDMIKFKEDWGIDLYSRWNVNK